MNPLPKPRSRVPVAHTPTHALHGRGLEPRPRSRADARHVLRQKPHATLRPLQVTDRRKADGLPPGRGRSSQRGRGTYGPSAALAALWKRYPGPGSLPPTDRDVERKPPGLWPSRGRRWGYPRLRGTTRTSPKPHTRAGATWSLRASGRPTSTPTLNVAGVRLACVWRGVAWLAGQGSNLEPPDPKSGVLPVELPANGLLVTLPSRAKRPSRVGHWPARLRRH